MKNNVYIFNMPNINCDKKNIIEKKFGFHGKGNKVKGKHALLKNNQL